MIDLTLPTPILLHPLKHHLGWIRQWLEGYVSNSPADLIQFKNSLRTIGESQMDLYLGTLTVEEVAQQIRLLLQTQNKLGPEEYQNWLEEAGGYRIVHLSDGSQWTLRWGHSPDRYVHVHPARYSPHSVRVKASSMKTALAVLVWHQLYPSDAPDLATINGVRTQWLDYPPIKSPAHATAIERVSQLLLNGTA